MGQYYAHPQNQFWRLMGDIYGAHAGLPYEKRIEIIKEHDVAIWDVLAACERLGSMDADIHNPVVNNFNALFAKYPSLRRVVFDSAAAEGFYKRLVMPTLTHKLDYTRVPSPSPANTRLRYEEKRIIWMAVLKKM